MAETSHTNEIARREFIALPTGKPFPCFLSMHDLMRFFHPFLTGLAAQKSNPRSSQLCRPRTSSLTTRPFSAASKALCRTAYPVFLANYPLECTPIKPGHPNASCGLGREDILKIIYPPDDERFRVHLYEVDRVKGIRTGFAEPILH